MILETPHDMAVNAAKRFKELRKTKRVTIKSLSESSGVPYSTIRRFESKGEISFMSLVKITSALGEDREITELFAEQVPSSIEEIIRKNRKK
jgi:transcriptional regulator with XRE-family HTH domain